ncbi:DUF6602 domain-containing protein [Romboutsia lituseburensis]|uniref:DUF6602 domain-containing protein n=1 Tax=Romboutsia lituseburensis TaxID=1537 RepID=UPI00215A55D0|nr:DUF6602 domain-containing protein [Romboutsia lituseburensis]MCR8747264.1 hypothetical protein [Romboutsia lituseburensis]
MHVSRCPPIYGIINKSHEVDIAIWDANNYPKLKMHGHSLLFQESVKLAIEVKTNYSKDVLNDILTKCESIKMIPGIKGPDIEDRLFSIEQKIYCMENDVCFNGTLISKPDIATAAIIFKGGHSFDIENIDEKIIDIADEVWPDIIIFIEAGKVILKQYEYDEDGRINSYIEMLESKEDSLLVFTSSLLGILTDRSINLDDPFYLSKYIDTLNEMESKTRSFNIIRPTSGRRII